MNNDKTTGHTPDGQEIYNVIVENGSGNPYTDTGEVMGTFSGEYMQNWHSLVLDAPGLSDGKHQCILSKDGDNEIWILVPEMLSYAALKAQRDELVEALQRIAKMKPKHGFAPTVKELQDIAESALNKLKD